MRPRTRRSPVLKPSALQAMIQAAVPILAAYGSYRSPAVPWIAAANLSMKVAQGCGWNLQGTPEAYLGPILAHRGWTWVWEGDDLVLGLPGWIQPKPILVAIYVGLFDETSMA
jgi:hypothetical protein